MKNGDKCKKDGEIEGTRGERKSRVNRSTKQRGLRREKEGERVGH